MPARNRAAEARRAASTRVHDVTSHEEANDLAALLLTQGRTHPAVVITTPSGRTSPFVDPEPLAAALPSGVEVFVIASESIAWSLTRALPDLCQVYGGASRVYPAGTEWCEDPYMARLVFAYSQEEAASATSRIVDEVNRLLRTAPQLPAPERGAPSTATSSEVPPQPSAQGREVTSGPPAEARSDEREQLVAELKQALQEIARLRRLREQDVEDRRRLREQARGTRNATDGTVESFDNAFSGPEEQFRFEVYLAWVRRVPAASKQDHPLRRFTVGPQFLDSLSLSGVERRKVVDVVMEAATGLDKELTGRDLHQLRSGVAGNAPYVVRDDGATCWRVSLQTNTPSSRRLHYWRAGSEVELSRVVLHDDFLP